jgi:hypothetical protein
MTEPVACERRAVMTTMTWSDDTLAGDPGDARGSALGQRILMTECHFPAGTGTGGLTDRDGLDPADATDRVSPRVRRWGHGRLGPASEGTSLIDTHGLPQ